MVEEAEVQIEAKDYQERTPLYFACREGGLEIIKYLYKKGANMNSKTKHGRTILTKASYLGIFEITSYLLECPEILIDMEDGKKRTALHNAAFGPKGRRDDPHLGANDRDSPECT